MASASSPSSSTTRARLRSMCRAYNLPFSEKQVVLSPKTRAASLCVSSSSMTREARRRSRSLMTTWSRASSSSNLSRSPACAIFEAARSSTLLALDAAAASAKAPRRRLRPPKRRLRPPGPRLRPPRPRLRPPRRRRHPGQTPWKGVSSSWQLRR